MGMFDSFLLTRKCSTCKKTTLREMQTKAFANALICYRVGDVVENAPVGESWLKEYWWCEDCRRNERKPYEHYLYLRFIDGLFIGFYTEKEYDRQRKKALDTYEIMQLYRKNASRATDWRLMMQHIYRLIENSREIWKRKDKKDKEQFFMLPKNEKALLDRIAECIKRDENIGLNDIPPE